MYLEISSRQVGKSTRLINQISADKPLYDLQIIMGMNLQHCKCLNKRIKQNNKVKMCLSYDSFINTISRYQNLEKVRLYVDEFMFSTCFCNNFDQLLQHYNSIILNGYYASSFNNVYNNTLLKLQGLNNNFITTVSVHQMIIS